MRVQFVCACACMTIEPNGDIALAPSCLFGLTANSSWDFYVQVCTLSVSSPMVVGASAADCTAQWLGGYTKHGQP